MAPKCVLSITKVSGPLNQFFHAPVGNQVRYLCAEEVNSSIKMKDYLHQMDMLSASASLLMQDLHDEDQIKVVSVPDQKCWDDDGCGAKNLSGNRVNPSQGSTNPCTAYAALGFKFGPLRRRSTRVFSQNIP